MGVTMSTLDVSMSTAFGWTVIIVGAVLFQYIFKQKKPRVGAGSLKRIEDRRGNQSQDVHARRESKDKSSKKQRAEAYNKENDANNRPQAAKAATPAKTTTVEYSTDEGIDNVEFAYQLSSARQGANLSGPRKSNEKKAKMVKQSRAPALTGQPDQVSPPSSTTGVDGDDDESSVASREVKAQDSPVFNVRDAHLVDDMLEPMAAGPSILRLTSTEEKPKKQRNAKPAVPEETKKQRQNRQKAEAAKALRQEAEKERLVALETQRQLVRKSEGRPATDGSAFLAAQANKQSPWTESSTSNRATNGLNGSSGYIPVQPLDTLDITKPVLKEEHKAGILLLDTNNVNWMSTLPSEEEQMKLLDEEREWLPAVKKKKVKKPSAATSPVEKEDKEAAKVEDVKSAVTHPQQLTPVTNPPVVTKTQVLAAPKSSFSALSTDDLNDEEEEEWDV